MSAITAPIKTMTLTLTSRGLAWAGTQVQLGTASRALPFTPTASPIPPWKLARVLFAQRALTAQNILS